MSIFDQVSNFLSQFFTIIKPWKVALAKFDFCVPSNVKTEFNEDFRGAPEKITLILILLFATRYLHEDIEFSTETVYRVAIVTLSIVVGYLFFTFLSRAATKCAVSADTRVDRQVMHFATSLALLFTLHVIRADRAIPEIFYSIWNLKVPDLVGLIILVLISAVICTLIFLAASRQPRSEVRLVRRAFAHSLISFFAVNFYFSLTGA